MLVKCKLGGWRHYCALARCSSARSMAVEDAQPFVPVSRKRTIATRNGNDSLCRRLLDLVYPRRSAVIAIQKWKDEGFTARKYELNRVVRQLRKFKRYKHALEVCEWMRIQKDIVLQPGDYALHLDLISKVRGVESAEKFFQDLPEASRGHHTCTALLHCYVRRRDAGRAEALMSRMLECGLCHVPLPHNAILSLYLSTGRPERVPAAVARLKTHSSPDTLSYNLWLSACSASGDLPAAESVFLEILSAKNVGPDWMTLGVMADLYARSSLPEKALPLLSRMEPLASPLRRPAFSSLLTLYTALGRLDRVRHTWRRMKSWFPKLGDSEYVCMAAALARLSSPEQAEDLYSEWRRVSGTGNPKVANLVLAAYVGRGDVDAAEAFYRRMAGDGTDVRYGTFSVMARGYLGRGDFERVLEFFAMAVSSLKSSGEEDFLKLVGEIFERLEARGDVHGAERLLVVLRKSGRVTTGAYNSLLRTYLRAGTAPLVVEERMRSDGVEPDGLTRELAAMTSSMPVCGTTSSCVVKTTPQFLS